jgi:hypothetical protein
MDELLTNVKTQIIAQIRATSNIERITKELLYSILEGYRLWMDGNRVLTADEKKVLHEELSNYFIADLNYDTDLVELERGMVISDPDPKKHTKWEPDSKKRFYWRKQREFLMTTLERKNGQAESSRIINSIDFETETILKNMENPIRRNFDSRGLVVGYVQSGKTANFTALIAKAADAGYRFIVVLAGIHDELRQQTQIRIDKELTGYNDLKLEPKNEFIHWNDYEETFRWNNLTSAGWLEGKETGEFSGRGINSFRDEFLSIQKPVIAIIKKNVKIMDRLIKWIENSEEKDRINVPLLIIDDEADQASLNGFSYVNSKKANISDEWDEETDNKESSTYSCILNLRSAIPNHSYVQYTATPQGPLLISIMDLLSPKSHTVLTPGKKYTGGKTFFQDFPDLVISIPDEEVYHS